MLRQSEISMLCDRCGNATTDLTEAEGYQNLEGTAIFNTLGAEVVNRDNLELARPQENCDLCPDCFNSFVCWLKGDN